MGDLRDRLLNTCGLVRHSLVLDLKAGSGLLTWEALRRVPEGGVYALARTGRDAEALRQLAERLPEPERPLVLEGEIGDLPALLAGEPGLAFDGIVGYNCLLDAPDRRADIGVASRLVAPGGVISIAERIPRHTQRLYQLVDLGELGDDLADRMSKAEEAIYVDADDPLVNWDAPELAAWWEAAGLAVTWETAEETTEVRVTDALLARWFAPAGDGRPSYAQRLAAQLSGPEVARVEALFRRQLLNQVVRWRSRTVYLAGKKDIG